MQISRNIVNGPKSNNIGFGGNLGYRLHPETISPLLQTFLSLRMFENVFRGSSLYPKQLSLFCLLWLISASADPIGHITSSFCSMTELLQELKKSSC